MSQPERLENQATTLTFDTLERLVPNSRVRQVQALKIGQLCKQRSTHETSRYTWEEQSCSQPRYKVAIRI